MSSDSGAVVHSAETEQQAASGPATIHLALLVPDQILVNSDVRKIVAEGTHGSFCLLPRHVDFVAALVPGLLAFVLTDGREEFAAVAEGILVKQGRNVQVSVVNAVRGAALGDLRRAVHEQFRQLDERDQRAHHALARLEADFVRRFLELRA